MAEEPTNVAAPAEAPKVEAPKAKITEQEFLDRGYALIEEGEAAGLPVTALLVRLGVRKSARDGESLLDNVLAGLRFGRPPVVRK